MSRSRRNCTVNPAPCIPWGYRGCNLLHCKRWSGGSQKVSEHFFTLKEFSNLKKYLSLSLESFDCKAQRCSYCCETIGDHWKALQTIEKTFERYPKWFSNLDDSSRDCPLESVRKTSSFSVPIWYYQADLNQVIFSKKYFQIQTLARLERHQAGGSWGSAGTLPASVSKRMEPVRQPLNEPEISRPDEMNKADIAPCSPGVDMLV